MVPPQIAVYPMNAAYWLTWAVVTGCGILLAWLLCSSPLRFRRAVEPRWKSWSRRVWRFFLCALARALCLPIGAGCVIFLACGLLILLLADAQAKLERVSR